MPKKMVDILGRGLGHTNSRIKMTASDSLKFLCRAERFWQAVLDGYAKYIFKADEIICSSTRNYKTSCQQITDLLGLYIELLDIWIKNLRLRKPSTFKSGSESNQTLPSNDLICSDENIVRASKMEDINLMASIETIEAYGLYYLCCQLLVIRFQAMRILKIVCDIEVLLTHRNESNEHIHKRSKCRDTTHRLIEIFSDPNIHQIIDLDSDSMSVAERSCLQKLRNKKPEDFLYVIIGSENPIDIAIWHKYFPTLIKICFERFPITVVICRNLICSRLILMQTAIQNLAATGRRQKGIYDAHLDYSSNSNHSPPVSGVHSYIERWEFNLIVAFTTLTITDKQPVISNSNSSKIKASTINLTHIVSAREIFSEVIPLLTVENAWIRSSVIAGLGCINLNLYKMLVGNFQPIISELALDTRVKQNFKPKESNQLRGDQNNRNRLYRIEVTPIPHLTSHFLKDEKVLCDQCTLNIIIEFIKDTKNFLCDMDVQNQWEFNAFRRHICGLVE
jgi:hypothetical protein